MLGLALSIALVIVADRDATLIEQPDGELANAAGSVMFAGRTNQPFLGCRRALIHFDLGEIEAAAAGKLVIAESVAVVLTNVTRTNVEPREYRLHRLLADWTEGTSETSAGVGVPSTPGDATWIHRSYPDAFWMHAGAQFEGTPSARVIVSGPGAYRFEGEGLARDLALWLRDPSQNFGWILIGDETTPRNARAFASREYFEPEARPALELTFRQR